MATTKPKSEVIGVKTASIASILLPVNPLLQDPAMITPCQETEQKVQIINEIDSLAEINKQQLSVRRERIALEVDNKKLNIAKKTADTLDTIINAKGLPSKIA